MTSRTLRRRRPAERTTAATFVSTPTSARKEGPPDPSMTQPFLRIKSKFTAGVAVRSSCRRDRHLAVDQGLEGRIQARQRYQLATVRYGRHGSAISRQTAGLGSSGSPKRSRIATRIPRSPTGKTSGRFSAKIRNISAVQTPMPLTAVSRATIALSSQPVEVIEEGLLSRERPRRGSRTYAPSHPTARRRAPPPRRRKQTLGECGSPARARSRASIEAAAFEEICWPMIARTESPEPVPGLSRAENTRVPPGRSSDGPFGVEPPQVGRRLPPTIVRGFGANDLTISTGSPSVNSG